MGYMRVKDTNVSILDILELLADCRSTAEILRRFPSISATDIASAAAIARYLIIYHWAVCHSPDSALLPDRRGVAPTPKGGNWTPQEEKELARLFRSGSSIENMARIFITMQSDIIECLERLNLT